MANTAEVTNMALFCDFENVALGVQEAKYERFDIGKVLERLLLKGSIVVKKAYCDWERYKAFKAPMHEASFELIEIPHVRQSGKRSEEHTSELQSHLNLVCRLLLEKKNINPLLPSSPHTQRSPERALTHRCISSMSA